MGIYYFKFQCREWLTSETVNSCSLAAQGLFIRLLALSWLNDGLPGDLKTLQKQTKCETKAFLRHFEEIEDQFPISEDGRRRNPFQEELRAKALAFSNQQAQRQLDRWAKERGEQPRHSTKPLRENSTKLPKKHRLGNTEPIPCNYDYVVNTLPLGNVKKKKPAPEAFEQFWKAYPRKVGKAAALRAWDTHVKTPELAATVLDVIGVRNTHPHGWPAEVKFIPHAATWLNQGRWEDDWQNEGRRRGPETPAKPPPGKRSIDFEGFDPDMFNSQQQERQQQ